MQKFPLSKLWPFLVLIVCILSFGIYLLINQSQKEKENPEVTIQEEHHNNDLCGGGSSIYMSLSEQDEDVVVGDTVTVIITVDSKDCEIDAVDTIVHFNSEAVEVIDIHEGTDFAMYPLKEIKKDTIKISALANIGEPVKGTIDFASFSFIANKAGETVITLAFKEGSTVDSNVVEHESGKDLLSDVKNLFVNIE